jgi:ABC-2 type transport system ATP-binding protein
MPGVEAAAVFGRALHVAGTDRAALESAIRAADGETLDGAKLDGAKLDGAKLSWQEVEPRLEDVFIHMLSMDQNRRPSP